MSEQRKCTECGAELPENLPGSSCAVCVLQAALTVADAPEQAGKEKAGDRIGKYKLLEKIGEGGCGSVYMAEQVEPIRRRVALKVVKLGMDTEQVIARFEAERQALALMDHPHIAKVLDAGSTDLGRPYFVMELVRGIKITTYCDENKLGTLERLNLFIQVCHAIQHAHQKGIIHRDIKPSNVLITEQDGRPVPKVIDFGIAKATSGQPLTDKTVFTSFEQFIGTPAYMSPEQARLSSLDIDTRTDIYSLGVLLYELLTGKTPFDTKRLLQGGIDEIRRIIREEDPPRPSTRLSTLEGIERTEVAKRRHSDALRLIGFLRGDLDWIVMKTLEKDRTRRYHTAESLALDLQRYLKNEPVTAVAPSAVYAFRKFAKRNKLALLAASSGTAGLLVLAVVSVLWAAHANRLRRIAEGARTDEAAARAEAVAERDRTRAALTRIQLQTAEHLFSTDTPKALATLARILRNEPTNRVAAERLLNALSQRSFLVPALPPFPAGCSLARSSRDGLYIATAFSDNHANTVRMHERTGRLAAELPHGATPVQTLDVTADGGLIATAAGTRVRVWSSPGVNLLLDRSTTNGTVRHVQLLSRQQLLLVAGCTVELWRSSDGVVLRECSLPEGLVVQTAVSEEAGLLATADDYGNLRIYGLESLDLRRDLPKAHSQTVRCLRLSPDGSLLVSAGADSVARVWHTQTGQRIAEMRHSAPVYAAAFSPDGRRIATASRDRSVKLWGAAGQPLATLMRHKESLNSVQFSEDGLFLVTAADDGTVRQWNLETFSEETEPARFAGPVLEASFMPGGCDVLVSVAAGGVHLLTRTAKPAWSHVSGAPTERPGPVQPGDTEKAAYERAHTREITFVDVSPDGRLAVVASADGMVRVWNRQTLTRVGEALVHNGAVSCARISADGMRVATSTTDHLFRVWDVQTGAPLTDWLGLDASVPGVWFSADGSSVISADGFACPVHKIQGPVSDWLPKLAESLAGLRLNAEYLEEPVPAGSFLELRAALVTSPQGNPLTAWMKQFLAAPTAYAPRAQAPTVK